MALLTEDQQNVAVRALATTLGKDVSEIETILTGDKPGDVDTLISQRIKAVRNEGDKAGRGTLQKAANKLAKDLFALDSTPETIEDLLNDVKEKYKPEVDPTKLTEEQVKMHPTFRTLEGKLQEKDNEMKKAVDDAKAEARAEIDLANLKTKAVQYRQELGAVIPEDSKIAGAMDHLFMQGLVGVTTKVVDGKTEFWKDGSRIENDKSFPLSEADFFKGLVEANYTTKVSDQKTSTGLNPEAGKGGQQGQGEKKFKGEWPKTQQEYDAIMADRQKYDVDQRQEVVDYWKEQTSKP